MVELSPDKLIAHRGHQATFPENSRLSILDAIAAGAQKIEFDIQFTRDGVPVLYHDEDMQRISGVDNKITQLEYAELAAFFVKEPKRLGSRFTHNPIEALEQVASIVIAHPHIQFFMEIKKESVAAHGDECCFERLQTIFSIVPKNLIIISFQLSSVQYAKQLGFFQTALVFRDWENRNALLAEAQADYGFINYSRIPQDETIVADKPIFVYEVTFPLVGQKLLERGAAAVETFNIRAFLNNL